MYHMSAQGIDERMVNVYYYYYSNLLCSHLNTKTDENKKARLKPTLHDQSLDGDITVWGFP